MTDPTVRIAPSLLSADFAHLADEIARVEQAGADLLHLDIMDGHFVPNLSFGVPVVESIARCTDLLLDTHLMISDPARYAPAFVEAGAGSITFHIEVAEEPAALVALIRELGVRVGVALNPDTAVERIEPILPDVDLVLVMTVQPGFGGQSFRRDCLGKIEWVAQRLDRGQWLEVDGGISPATAPEAVRAGADTLVAGHAIFRQDDPAAALQSLRAAATAAAGPRSETHS